MSLLLKTKTHRLHLLQKALQNNPMCFNEIAAFYGTFGIEKSKRQIQRDVKELELFLAMDLQLRTFFIQKEKFFFLEAKHHNTKQSNGLDPIFVATHFYEPLLTPEDKQKIAVLKKALLEDLQIGVTAIINDETVDNAAFEKKAVIIIPLQLLYHRNNYYLGGYQEKTKVIGIFNIKQLIGIHLSAKQGNADRYQALLTKELESRFGITKNINNTIYNIQIQIAPILVAFIKNNHWHASQKIKKEKNKYYLYLTCGINRELIGWLFQWMYNVKIIEPPILKKYYEKSLKQIIKVNQNNLPLMYRNLFEYTTIATAEIKKKNRNRL